MIGRIGTGPPGGGARGASYGGDEGKVGGTIGVSSTTGGGSSGENGGAGRSEMRLPQRVLDAFLPSVISVSFLKSNNFLLVQ